MLHHPEPAQLLASALGAGIGTAAAGFTAVFLAVASPPPSADAGATQLYILCTVALLFMGGVVKIVIDYRKGILQATAGTDRERADKLHAEVAELTIRHAAEVAELTKANVRHKSIVAENIARTHFIEKSLEDADRRNQRLAEINSRLIEILGEASIQQGVNNSQLTATNRILVEKQSAAPPESPAPEPGPVPLPVRDVDKDGE